MSSPSQQEFAGTLGDRIRLLLSGTLGASPFAFRQPSNARSTLFGSLLNGVSYAIVFCGLPWIIFKDSGPLFWLSVWASCYFAFAAAIARVTSSSILKVIENSILPDLSETTTAAIDEDLAHRFDRTKISVVALLVALFAAAVSG